MKTRFHPESYSSYRPSYPIELFSVLKPALGGLLRSGETIQVLDLGAGTGNSTRAFLDFFPHSEVTLCEPDPGMRKFAQQELENVPQVSRIHEEKAEALRLEKESLDVILCGCAWHWFDMDRMTSFIADALKPGGLAFIFEYQFPKAQDAGLQEFLRRQFNQEWRAPGQQPRGSLSELVEPLRKNRHLSQVARRAIEQIDSLDLAELQGVIESQSRYQWFESGLSADLRLPYREKLRETLQAYFESVEKTPKKQAFLYLFEGFLFKKRAI